MFLGFTFRCLFAVALLACGATVCGQSANPSDAGAILEGGRGLPTAPPDQGSNGQAGSGILKPWRAVPSLSGSPTEPSPPSPDANQKRSDSSLKPNGFSILKFWRAVPSLSGSPTEPSPPSPNANQKQSDSQLKPNGSGILMPWRAVPSLSGSPTEPSPPNPDADQQGSDSPLKPMTPGDLTPSTETLLQSDNPVSPMDTNQLVSVEEATNPDDADHLQPAIPGDNMTRAPSMNLPREIVEVPNEESRHLWRIVPRLFTQFEYDSNIYITKTNPVASSLTTLGLGFRAEYGDFRSKNAAFLVANYYATYNMYGKAPQENSLDQIAQLEAQYSWHILKTHFSSMYSYINGPNRDTGSFVKGTYVQNTLDFIHPYSPKTTMTLTLAQRGQIFSSPGLQNSEFYEVRFSPSYQLTPKISLGPQALVGVNTVAGSPDQRYQTLSGVANYLFTGKLSLQALGGFEFNEYASGGQNSFGTSVFSLGTTYTPNASTTCNLTAYRNLNNSASLQGQDYIATGVAVGIHHRMWTRWQPDLLFGMENDQYISNLSTVQSGRVDNYYFLMPGLQYNFLKDDRLSLRIFYQIRTNVSNEEQTYGWQDNQAGIQLKSTF